MGGTKTSKFHDLWIFEPLGPLIYGFKSTKILQNIRKYGHMFHHLLFCKSQLWENQTIDFMEHIWERWTPEDGEYEILKT